MKVTIEKLDQLLHNRKRLQELKESAEKCKCIMFMSNKYHNASPQDDGILTEHSFFQKTKERIVETIQDEIDKLDRQFNNLGIEIIDEEPETEKQEK